MAIGLTLAIAACDAPPADLRTWTPQDHQHTTQSGAQAKGQVDGETKEVFPGVDQVTVATWSSKCVMCHGRVGRGDGPQARMYGPKEKPKDLTEPAWHAAIQDEQIAATIRNGKGKMPPFALPDATIEGLVRLVRLFNRDRTDSSAAAATGSAAATAPTTAAATSKAGPSAGGSPSASE